MKKHFWQFAAVLAALTLAAVFAGCGGGKKGGDNSPVSSVEISHNTSAENPRKVGIGQTIHFTVTVNPQAAAQGFNVQALDGTANVEVTKTAEGFSVKGLEEGTAKIKAVSTANSGKYDECFISVVPAVPVTGVSLNKSSLDLIIREDDPDLASETITAAIAPSNATNDDLIWTIEDETIAVYEGSGLTVTVTAVQAGSTKITVKTADGNKTAEAAINVRDGNGDEPVNPIDADKTTITLYGADLDYGPLTDDLNQKGPGALVPDNTAKDWALDFAAFSERGAAGDRFYLGNDYYKTHIDPVWQIQFVLSVEDDTVAFGGATGINTLGAFKHTAQINNWKEQATPANDEVKTTVTRVGRDYYLTYDLEVSSLRRDDGAAWSEHRSISFARWVNGWSAAGVRVKSATMVFKGLPENKRALDTSVNKRPGVTRKPFFDKEYGVKPTVEEQAVVMSGNTLELSKFDNPKRPYLHTLYFEVTVPAGTNINNVTFSSDYNVPERRLALRSDYGITGNGYRAIKIAANKYAVPLELFEDSSGYLGLKSDDTVTLSIEGASGITVDRAVGVFIKHPKLPLHGVWTPPPPPPGFEGEIELPDDGHKFVVFEPRSINPLDGLVTYNITAAGVTMLKSVPKASEVVFYFTKTKEEDDKENVGRIGNNNWGLNCADIEVYIPEGTGKAEWFTITVTAGDLLKCVSGNWNAGNILVFPFDDKCLTSLYAVLLYESDIPDPPEAVVTIDPAAVTVDRVVGAFINKSGLAGDFADKTTITLYGADLDKGPLTDDMGQKGPGAWIPDNPAETWPLAFAFFSERGAAGDRFYLGDGYYQSNPDPVKQIQFVLSVEDDTAAFGGATMMNSLQNTSAWTTQIPNWKTQTTPASDFLKTTVTRAGRDYFVTWDLTSPTLKRPDGAAWSEHRSIGIGTWAPSWSAAGVRVKSATMVFDGLPAGKKALDATVPLRPNVTRKPFFDKEDGIKPVASEQTITTSSKTINLSEFGADLPYLHSLYIEVTIPAISGESEASVIRAYKFTTDYSNAGTGKRLALKSDYGIKGEGYRAVRIGPNKYAIAVELFEDDSGYLGLSSSDTLTLIVEQSE